ncbi:hypothetical protein IWZ00DRAFT_494135 [Phyllosticta capitalensis]
MYSPFVLSLYDQEQPFLDEIRAWETLAVDVDQKALMARNGLEARIKIADLLYQQVMGEYSLPTEKYAQLLTSTFDEFKGLLHTVDRVFEAEKCVMAQLAGSKASREHLLGLVCEAASNDDPAFMGLVEQLADGFHILKREFYRCNLGYYTAGLPVWNDLTMNVLQLLTETIAWEERVVLEHQLVTATLLSTRKRGDQIEQRLIGMEPRCSATISIIKRQTPVNEYNLNILVGFMTQFRAVMECGDKFEKVEVPGEWQEFRQSKERLHTTVVSTFRKDWAGNLNTFCIGHVLEQQRVKFAEDFAAVRPAMERHLGLLRECTKEMEDANSFVDAGLDKVEEILGMY